MRHKVFLNKVAAKSLAGMEKGQRALMAERLKGLEGLPNARLGVVKIAGEGDTFRLRSGDYRALFRVYEKERMVVVTKIDRRSRVYK